MDTVAERLLTVEDAFVARGTGVHVMPRFTAERAQPRPFAVTLRRPDGTEQSARATVEVAHMRGPLAPFAMYVLLDVAPEDVPIGTEIWSVDEAPS
jgi:hypothetical protein